MKDFRKDFSIEISHSLNKESNLFYLLLEYFTIIAVLVVRKNIISLI